MQIRTDQKCCPACGRDRLTIGPGAVDGNIIEYPCCCEACGWQGTEVYVDFYFVGHTNASGVMCGYSLT